MKIIIYLFLLSVASATCDTDAVYNGYNAESQNSITSPEYSKINQQVYETPALPKLQPITYKEVPASTYVPPTKALSKEADNKPIPIKAAPSYPVIYKPTPLVKVINEVDPSRYNTQIYTVPKSIVQTYSTAVENEDENTNAYSKDNAGPVQYQYQEEYPPLSTGPTYAPPVAIYNPIYPAGIRRGLFTPAYDKRVYPRFYNVVPQPYRSLGYGNPLAYTVPSAAYGYPSQSDAGGYNYGSLSLAYDNGLPQIRYNGFINADYDDFLKKKK